ncbi:hypothetical protein LJC53_06105 [Bacteroidales bacterium OttesenSCG-928-C03]|nr:hypothetical protein [Bacteroidales bacterium OttesenSCG-928-E04]MDL2309138.1 hypothetical protein [Bacteroidales bacterium OttesenSCG-928-C03]
MFCFLNVLYFYSKSHGANKLVFDLEIEIKAAKLGKNNGKQVVEDKPECRLQLICIFGVAFFEIG